MFDFALPSIIVHKYPISTLFNKVDQTGTLLLPNKTSINERLLVHRSVQIIIGILVGYTT